MVWMLIEWGVQGKPKLVGFVSGALAGLVAITPAAGFVSTQDAVLIVSDPRTTPLPPEAKKRVESVRLG